jgi:hypothetical protein
MTRYALVIDDQVVEERNYATPPAVKLVNNKPMLREIEEVTAPYDPETQTYTISRTITNTKVIDTWVVTDKPREAIDARLLAALAAHRYAVETGGTTVGGVPLNTDRDTQAVLTAARTLAKEDSGYSVKWKAANGSFFTLNSATIIAAANAVAAYVQKCFSSEATVAGDIANYTTAAEVTEAFDATMEA